MYLSDVTLLFKQWEHRSPALTIWKGHVLKKWRSCILWISTAIQAKLHCLQFLMENICHTRSIYCARAQQGGCITWPVVPYIWYNFVNRNFCQWCSNIRPSSWGGNRRRAKVIRVRLNNYRRLSGYFGKSFLAVAMGSIAWIAKMVCWGDGANVSTTKASNNSL